MFDESKRLKYNFFLFLRVDVLSIINESIFIQKRLSLNKYFLKLVWCLQKVQHPKMKKIWNQKNTNDDSRMYFFVIVQNYWDFPPLVGGNRKWFWMVIKKYIAISSFPPATCLKLLTRNQFRIYKLIDEISANNIHFIMLVNKSCNLWYFWFILHKF